MLYRIKSARKRHSLSGFYHVSDLRGAFLATPLKFDSLAFDRETMAICTGEKASAKIIVVHLLDSPATTADQQLKTVLMLGTVAGKEGIERFDAMDEALFDQEIQRAIDRGRAGGTVFLGKLIQKVVCLECAMTVGDQFQHTSPDRGETHATLQALAFSLVDQRKLLGHEESWVSGILRIENPG